MYRIRGVDYNKVFSWMIKHVKIKVILKLTTQLGLELKQLGVKIDFLHGELEEETYMQRRDGFEEPRKKSFSL